VGYLKASREEKGRIIDAVKIVTGLHRKAVIRAFRREQMRSVINPSKKPGPSVTYTNDVTAALKEIWLAGNEVCGELLHPVINEYITIFTRDKMWQYGDEVTKKLCLMSLGTMAYTLNFIDAATYTTIPQAQ